MLILYDTDILNLVEKVEKGIFCNVKYYCKEGSPI